MLRCVAADRKSSLPGGRNTRVPTVGTHQLETPAEVKVRGRSVRTFVV